MQVNPFFFEITSSKRFEKNHAPVCARTRSYSRQKKRRRRRRRAGKLYTIRALYRIIRSLYEMIRER